MVHLVPWKESKALLHLRTHPDLQAHLQGPPSDGPPGPPSGSPTGPPQGPPSDGPSGPPSGPPTGPLQGPPSDGPSGPPSGPPTGPPQGPPSEPSAAEEEPITEEEPAAEEVPEAPPEPAEEEAELVQDEPANEEPEADSTLEETVSEDVPTEPLASAEEETSEPVAIEPTQEDNPAEQAPVEEPIAEEQPVEESPVDADREMEIARLTMEIERLRGSLTGAVEVIEEIEETPMPPVVLDNIVIPPHVVADFARMGRQLSRESLVKGTMGAISMLHPDEPGLMIVLAIPPCLLGWTNEELLRAPRRKSSSWSHC